ncbi:MAG TPA: galactokinase [Candidatus Sulfotelmatobacter sp.]|nr:galactokinase [Candidatus Sulfotelmatobacter sp.]
MIDSTLSHESIADLLATRFRQMFGTGMRMFRAPGRVNLIGEHTDYNDGFVMPAAIGFYSWVAAAKRQDRIVEAYSDRFDEKISLSLNTLAGPPRRHWSDFIRGVAATIVQAGHKLSGANLVIHGEVPLGAGLSSSASLEVATALAFTSTSGLVLPRLEMAKLCQMAEHEYVGTRCGIMDQFIATFGAAGNALMLDCRSLEYQLLPVPQDVRLVVCNTMVRHELASGEYNRRRADCEAGVKLLAPYRAGVRALRDVEIADLEKHKDVLPETIYRRCRHVITENQRVLDAAKALQSGDPDRVGQLMYASHASLRDDYEVSCKELDLLVELAAGSSGVYGARMTGGGFGGCTVNLVRTDCAEAFRTHIARTYQEATGIAPDIYICEPAQGAEAWPVEGSV